MKTPSILLLVISFIVLAFPASAANEGALAAPEWLMYNGTTLVPFEEGNSSVVYFRFAESYQGNEQRLRLSSFETFTLFVNNSLAGAGTNFKLDVDSLRSRFAAKELLIAIHQEGISRGTFKAEMVGPPGRAQLDVQEERPSFAFRDFAIVAALILIIMVIVIVRLNPKLASDYFSIPRIFSLREFEESQMYSRIGSSTNILFYLYCSLLLGFYLIVIFHFVADLYPVAAAFSGDSFGAHFFQWIKLSSILLLLLFLKIVIVFTMAYLFNIMEVAGVHFFNWVRLLVVFFGSFSVVLFIYFLWHGQNADTHGVLLKLLAWTIGAWIVLIFLKLSSKASASLFHLFSYICATELIPFLFIIRVLYN
jgi:hypothetical protein